MKKLYALILGLFTITLLLSCNEEDPCQDCYKNIFHCKINGQYWEPHCDPEPLFGCNASRLQYYDDTKFLELIARNDKTAEGIHLVIRKLDVNEKNIFETGSIYTNDTKVPSCLVYKIDTTNVSYLLVKTIDRTNRIITAEFSLVAKNSCNELVNINEGYFDLRY